MRWNFLNGVLVGGIIGAVMGLFYVAEIKPVPQPYISGSARRIGRRTNRVMAKMTRNIQGKIKKT